MGHAMKRPCTKYPLICSFKLLSRYYAELSGSYWSFLQQYVFTKLRLRLFAPFDLLYEVCFSSPVDQLGTHHSDVIDAASPTTPHD